MSVIQPGDIINIGKLAWDIYEYGWSSELAASKVSMQSSLGWILPAACPVVVCPTRARNSGSLVASPPHTQQDSVPRSLLERCPRPL